MSKKRIVWIDIAKGFGIICIVLGHVLKSGLLRQVFYAFSVPFFFILVGITYKYKSDAVEFYKGKLKRIIIPYFSFAMVSIIIFKYRFGNVCECGSNISTSIEYYSIGSIYPLLVSS